MRVTEDLSDFLVILSASEGPFRVPLDLKVECGSKFSLSETIRFDYVKKSLCDIRIYGQFLNLSFYV